MNRSKFLVLYALGLTGLTILPSYTIKEALKMEDVAIKTGRVVQVGSQQRSSAEFQKAIELVQNGSIGHIEKIYAKVGDPPAPYDLPEMPVPNNLNWNLWLGPLNDSKIHYNSDLCPPICLILPRLPSEWMVRVPPRLFRKDITARNT